MICDRVEECGAAEGDEAEPCGLGEMGRIPRVTVASQPASRSRGGREAGYEEGQKETEPGEPEVHTILEINIMDHCPGRTDFSVESQGVRADAGADYWVRDEEPQGSEGVLSPRLGGAGFVRLYIGDRSQAVPVRCRQEWQAKR